ncbi:MFS transporter [Ignatzschineria sp. LJL83]
MFKVSKYDNKKTRIKNVVGITMGNAIEFYDFGIYTVFAVLLGRLYFPAESEFVKLLLSFATLGVGFVSRPLGAIFLGLYSDKYGRKPALLLTLSLMALSIIIFILTPTYQAIGVLAPILIIFARLLQGFSLGGELGSSTAMLMEYADNNSRGFYGSWQMFGQSFSQLLAALIGGVLGILLPIEALELWGWRAAFAVGLIIIPIALYIRRNLPETLDVENVKGKEILRELFQKKVKLLIAGILLILGITAPTYIIGFYMANYSTSQLGMEFKYAVWGITTTGIVQAVLAPFMGKLTDKIGRKTMIFWGRLATIILIYPAFLILNQYPEPTVLIIIVGILSIFLSVNGVASIVMCAEIFPSRIRATGLSISYGFSVMIFGGFAQFFVTLLLEWTHNPLSPSFYVIGTVLISMLVLFLVPETSGKELE